MKFRYLSSILRRQASGKLGRLVVLSGARQVGKTTLVQHCFPEYQYVSVEDPAVRPAFSRMSAREWIRRYPCAIIDEVQKVPSLVETVKAAYDADERVRYILLGSSRLLLMEQVRESLAGRVRLADLWPLTLPEVMSRDWEDRQEASRLVRWIASACRDHEILEGIPAADDRYAVAVASWERHLAFGGMPILCDEDVTDADRRAWLKDYQRTYLERDVRDLAAFRDLEPFVLAQQALAERTGTLLNASDAARVTGVAPNTLRRFVRYLEMSYQVKLLPPYFRNHEKRLSKAPKIHFTDPGILRTITGRWGGPLTGPAFESAVVAEIWKQISTLEVAADLMHLRTHDGREVDLLIQMEQGFVAVEIKQAERVESVDARSLRHLDALLDRPVLGCLVISRDPRVRELGSGIWAVPAPWLLS